MPAGVPLEITVCPISDDGTELPILDRIPFEIDDVIEKSILIPACGVQIELYQARTIRIEEDVQEVTFNVEKTGLNTRWIYIIIEFVCDHYDGYSFSITRENI